MACAYLTRGCKGITDEVVPQVADDLRVRYDIDDEDVPARGSPRPPAPTAKNLEFANHFTDEHHEDHETFGRLPEGAAERFGSGAELVTAARAALGSKRIRRRRSVKPPVAAAAAVTVAAAAAIVRWPDASPGIAAIRTEAVAALIDPGGPSLRASVDLDGPQPWP